MTETRSFIAVTVVDVVFTLLSSVLLYGKSYIFMFIISLLNGFQQRSVQREIVVFST